MRVVVAEDLFLLREGLVRLLEALGSGRRGRLHSTSIFAKLDLAPSDDDNRRVLAVLAFLNS